MTDRDFYRVFGGLLGALVVLSVVLFILATMIVGGAGLNQTADETAVAERIKPIGEVAVGTGSMMDGVMASANAAPAAGADKGKATYDATCATCHAAGIAGAPKLGDKAAWKDRIAKGNATLYQHAIQGFQGKAGFMPPKGGNTALADADVQAAVDYMVKQSK